MSELLLAPHEESLVHAVQERLGLRIQAHQLVHFRRRVEETLQRFQLPSIDTLTNRVLRLNYDDPMMTFLVAGITVGESYFFRDPVQMDFLRSHYLPQLIARRKMSGKQGLRMWSAGCSDGQELYSLLILLHQLLPKVKDWELRLLGTDINAEALQRAERAEYRDWAIRGLPEEVKLKMFHATGPSWRLNHDLFVGITKFRHLNLIEDGYPSLINDTHGHDLILCRNVFIYFDNPTVDKIMARFARCLAPGGVLIIGACDYVPTDVPELVYRSYGNMFYFQKVEGTSQPEAGQESWQPPIHTPRSGEQTTPLSTLAASPARQLPPRQPASSAAASIQQGAKSSVAMALPEVMKLLKELMDAHRFGEVIQTIDGLPAEQATLPKLQIMKGYALTAQGELQAAETMLRVLIRQDDLLADSHFLLALVLQEQGDYRAAEGELRKVMMLDREHLLGHYHMGFLKLSQGKQEAGLRFLKRTRELAESADQVDRCLDPTTGMTVQQLLEQVVRQLEEMENG
uniref:Putative MCP methyltransferase, CheR-type [Include TPR repeats] n=1 Tax=Magnetococcus massalia (strain MO-1) TaxID=451514 RepID=A0A1S7LE22_MAGMO|nr:Putative MCP methyltransferase, CheR-type [Include TPR repeats] [Candidatus Magnetococcus massalia]